MQITPAEMIQWFRSKANEFNKIADGLESTFSPNGQPDIKVSPICPPPPITKKEAKQISAEDVKAVLTKFGKVSRSSKIAETLGVSQPSVLTILSVHTEMFEQVGRGWWQNKTISTEH